VKNFKTYLMLFFGMAFFGSATPVSKLVVQEFSVFVAGMLRVLMAFLILLPFVKLKRILDFKGKDAWLLTGIGVIGVLGFTAFLLYGMDMVSGVTGSIIMSSTPAITAGLSFLFFRDQFGWRKGAAIALAVGGVLVLQLGSTDSGSQGNSIWGIVLVVAAIFCEACYTLMGKALTKDFKPVNIAAFSALIGFLAFLPFAIYQYQAGDFASVSTKGWISLAWYGIGTMGLGSVLWYRGVQRVEGSTAAAFMGVMPLSALLLSYWLLGENFEWIHLGGFALVFTGVIFIIQSHRRMAAESEGD
jgi:drug/metabolite transporter (DMT)-like permease